MFTVTFWKDAAERALSSVAGAAVALLGAEGLGLLTADWASVGSVAGLAGVVSLLKALMARNVGDPESASLAK